MLSCELKKLDRDWRELLASQLGDNFDDPIVKCIDKFLSNAPSNFFPSKENMLKPFHSISVKDIRVVIVGHYPYRQNWQATGLPFSNPPHIPMRQSVKNIFKAMIVDIYGINHNDEKMLDEKMPSSGCLEYLPPQGVFLINRKFTNVDGGSGHKNKGWEEFSEAVICLLSTELDSSVFMLWGDSAKKLSGCIDDKKHLVLTAYHPSSRLSYDNPQNFLRCKHFSQANTYLKKRERGKFILSFLRLLLPNKYLRKKGRGKPIKWLNN